MAGITVKSYTRKELRELYGIGADTFRNWMRRAKVGIDHNRKILSTLEVEKFFRHHGPPEKLLTEEI